LVFEIEFRFEWPDSPWIAWRELFLVRLRPKDMLCIGVQGRKQKVGEKKIRMGASDDQDGKTDPEPASIVQSRCYKSRYRVKQLQEETQRCDVNQQQ
jgi:hypothetical protein